MADDGGDDDEAYTRKYAAARYALAGVYVLMAFLSLALLVTSPRAAAPPAGAPAKRGGWTWQRMFHVFVLLGLVGRAVFMFLQPSVEQNVLDMPNCVNVFISIMPSLLFFSGYIVLACFWCAAPHTHTAHARTHTGPSLPRTGPRCTTCRSRSQRAPTAARAAGFCTSTSASTSPCTSSTSSSWPSTCPTASRMSRRMTTRTTRCLARCCSSSRRRSTPPSTSS
eukprot:Unigene342_Nuclearia_a/m.1189 Unigene342_Nuclearia_a/g.1189  ORF Unigene342_Nuclearia_a/g.1189 Unigene342_Nuclearia_a/m.1189 type:complete len:224 (+) Unigene342_Nuclearia_a:42-713(+)